MACTFGLNALAIDGGSTGTAVRAAVAVFPVPPSVELTAPLVLVSVPGLVGVTLTLIVQLEPTAIDPPVSEIEPDPAVAVAVPPQVLLSAFGVETTNPDGSVSVNATPDSASVLADGLVSVNVSVLVPVTDTWVGLNAFEIDGGPTAVRVALAVLPVPPSVELTAPLVLFNDPAPVAVTLTVTVQFELAAITPSLSEIVFVVFAPLVVSTAPKQELVTPFGFETSSPAGSPSLNATPVSATPAFGLVSVNVSVLVPPTCTWVGLNALAIDGGSMTRFACSFTSCVASGVGNLKAGSVSPTFGSLWVHGTGVQVVPEIMPPPLARVRKQSCTPKSGLRSIWG